MVGSHEHTNESSDFIKGGEFLHELNDYSLLEKDCSTEIDHKHYHAYRNKQFQYRNCMTRQAHDHR